MENKYEKILRLFADADNEIRDWMNRPFLANSYAIGTDAYRMCYINKDKVGDIHILTEYDPQNVVIIIPQKTKSILSINVKNFVTKISKLDKIDETIGEDLDCGACCGECEIELDYSYNGKNYYIEAKCPVCDGSGLESESREVPTGKLITDPKSIIKIGNSTFYFDKIEPLIRICEILKSDTIELTYQESAAHGSNFTISDVDILIMPMQFNDDTDKISFSLD